MSEYAHKGQILPLVNQMIPIEKSTTFHASYDYGLHGFKQGKMIEPIGRSTVALVTKDSGHIEFPMVSFGSAQAWTAEISVKEIDSTSTAFFFGDNTGVTMALGFKDTEFYYRAQDTAYLGNYPIVRTDWNNVAVTYANGLFSFYINGALAGQVTQLSAAKFNAIGSGYTNNAYKFGGLMSNARLWNRALSGTEIRANTERVVSGDETGLLLYYKMGEREGLTAYNSCSSGSEGVLLGAITSAQGLTNASLRNNEGKYGGAVLIEPNTVNIAPYSNYSNRTYNNVQALGGWGGDAAEIIYYSSGGYNNLAYRTIRKTLPGTGGAYTDEHAYFAIEDGKTYTISAWMRSDKPVTLNSYAMCISRPSDNTYRNPSFDVALTPEWKRFVWTYTAGTGHAGDYVHRGIVYHDEDLPVDISWCGFQVEERSTATSYVNGTRGNGRLWYSQQLLNKSAFTMGLWFKVPVMHKAADKNTGINGSWHHPLIELAPPSTGGNLGYSIVAGPEPAPFSRKLMLRAGGDWSSTTQIQDDTWYHLIASFDGTTHKIYINGSLAITRAQPMPTIPADAVLMVGGGYQGKPNIMVDELRIESRAISEEEVAAWASSGLHYNYLDYSMNAE